MRRVRNIITLSNMDPRLEEWVREEARRTDEHFYEVVNEAIEVLRLARKGKHVGEEAAAAAQSPD